MSILILKKRPADSGPSFEYQIYRQSKNLGKGNIMTASNGIMIGAYGWPAYDSNPTPDGFGETKCLKLRGENSRQDFSWFPVAYNKWLFMMEQAVLELNIKFGNNKDLTIDDVIWKEDET